MYKVDSFFFSSSSGIRLFTEQWIPTEKPVKAIVQIAHGMRESTAYYKEFCEVLASTGYASVVHDARGHGRTAGKPGSREFIKNAGNIGENGIDFMVDDLAEITDFIKQTTLGVPVVLLGHSMGSVLARLYAARYGNKIDGLIYSGTTGPIDKARYNELLLAAQKELHLRGRLAPAADIPKLLFGHFNERFEPVKTGYEYMSRDDEKVKEAIGSPYASIPYRCGFFTEFIKAMGKMDLPAAIECIPKNLPILSVSGDMDPFGGYGEGVKTLFAVYKNYGLKHLRYILYEGGRHEMLREINRSEVFSDIIAWLDTLTNTNKKM